MRAFPAGFGQTPQDTEQMTAALAIEGLYKTYPNGFEALKGIDLTVQPGDFFALLGPNGAGKSTTIGIVCSLVNKTRGKVSVYGHDIDHDFSAAKKCLGIVPQEINFNLFEKVGNILVTQAGYYGLPAGLARQRTEKYLRQLGLWDKRNEVSRTLSGGMKRRLMIARALVHEPKLLILDEPTAGVDIEIRRSMWEFLTGINAQGTTIILTTHYLEEAESLCRNIAIIDKGEMLENTSMKALLKKLHRQTFVLDSARDLPAEVSLPGLGHRLLDSHTLEVDVEQGVPLNDVFSRLTAAGLEITSLRPKANRLEEMFMALVREDNRHG